MKKSCTSLLLSILLVGLIAATASALERVVVDVGHGGFESGIKGDRFREKDVALEIAREMKSFLGGEEIEVMTTRNVDRYLTLNERSNRIDAAEAEAVLSLHLSTDNKVNIYVAWYEGTEEGMTLRQYYDETSRQRRHLFASRLLAESLGEVFKDEFGIEVFLGIMPLPLLLRAGAPAVLVELPSKGVSYDAGTIARLAYTLSFGIQAYGRQQGQ